MPCLLDGKGLQVLYKTQVPSFLEYACLAWGGAEGNISFSWTRCRTVPHGTDNNTGPVPHLHTLQHGRDVAGLTVVFKVQERNVSRLQELRQSNPGLRSSHKLWP